ncbi:MAG: putative aldouronate transport system permease protein [Clostridiales bacterium]|nr:putative aldouronate transport system permease protein [Clostridiales bacterium]
MADLARGTDTQITIPTTSRWDIIRKDLVKNRYIYIMLLPVITYYIVFHYVPLYGAQIAFKNFTPSKGIWGSPWVGFKYFEEFFNSYYFERLLRNTVLISLYDLIFGFPAPIILALLLNEIKSNIFKRTVQTVTYLPHFISLVVICGMIIDFLARDGLVNNILNRFGIESIPFMIKPEWFRTIYVASNIWQGIGWGSIIYLAALSNIDPQLYEAATIDGAGRFRQVLHVTLPGILPTVVIMLILRLGQMLNVGSEKILLLYNTSTYETADVISTFVYRKGILEASYSYSTAIGLFNSVINFALLVIANFISRKATETSLW